MGGQRVCRSQSALVRGSRHKQTQARHPEFYLPDVCIRATRGVHAPEPARQHALNRRRAAPLASANE